MGSDEKKSPKVLLVDDKFENLALLRDMLEPLDAELFIAKNGEEALSRIAKNRFDLVLLDIIMPRINGYQICQRIKSDPSNKDLPVIFLSALQGIEDKIRGFEAGGDDFLSKPLVQREVIARVQLHLHKREMLKGLKHLLKRSYHELYTPLAVINSSVQLHEMKYGKNQYTDAVLAASKTLQVIYEDIYYSLSPIKHLAQKEAIDLDLFVQERIRYFQLLADMKQITVSFKGKANDPIQIGREDLLRIVDNTISNAIKYAKDSSVITLYTMDHADSIVFYCKNTGTIKHPENIFSHGYRESYEQIGMGIGLEIVDSICHQYGIVPQVVSQQGTTSFRYEFPKISSRGCI
jgi:CheY-like chemotaxis protein